MAQKSGFFDAMALGGGSFDRVYSAETFANYFASFIGNGFFGGRLNELQVNAKNDGLMRAFVNSGQAWINGYWYENNSELEVNFENSSATLNRIDRVVLRLDFALRSIGIFVVKGIPATTPISPSLTRNETVYELGIASVAINANTMQVSAENIFDLRFDPNYCGVVKGFIGQIDTTNYGGQLQNFINQYIETANDEYNDVFLPHLQGLKTLATEQYQEFLVWVNNLKNQIYLEKDSAFAEIQSVLDQLQDLLLEDDFGTLVARMEIVENDIAFLKPSTGVGLIAHGLETYPSVFAYEFTKGDGVTIDGEGIVTGATLASTPVKWVIQSPSVIQVFTRSGFGDVMDIEKINDSVYVAYFLDTNKSVYFKLGSQGASKNLFEVYWSQSDSVIDNPKSVKGWTGEFVVDGSARFSKFYDSLKNNHAGLQTTTTDYNTRIANQGSCSLYVIDRDLSNASLPGAIRFPTITNYIRPPRSSETIATELGDAIRNIKTLSDSVFNPIATGSGAIGPAPPFFANATNVIANRVITTEALAAFITPRVGFDASLVVPTANENRPKTQILYSWIFVGG